MHYRSNWNLEVLVFKEKEKPEYVKKNLSEQGREPTTNSTHIWRRCQDSNPGHIGGRRVLSPLRHPCSIYEKFSHFLTKFLYNNKYSRMQEVFKSVFRGRREKGLFKLCLHQYCEDSKHKQALNNRQTAEEKLAENYRACERSRLG